MQLVKLFPAFHGTRRIVTALTSVRHLPLYWTSPIQSIYPHPTTWRSIPILSTHLRLSSGLLPCGFPTKTLYNFLSSPIRATCPAYLILLSVITRTILRVEYKSFSSSFCNFLHSTLTPPPSSKYSPQIHFLIKPVSFPPATSATKFHTHTKQQPKLYFSLCSTLIFWIATWKTKNVLLRRIASIY